MKQDIIIFSILLLLFSLPVFSQVSSPTPEPIFMGQATLAPGQTQLPSLAPGQTPPPLQPTPQKPAPAKIAPVTAEYTPGEFPGWAFDLRRAEIIFIGSLPLTFFLVIEFYDSFRFTYYGLAENMWDTRYAPWPVYVPDKFIYTDKEKVGILVSALTLALLTSTADYIIGRINHRNLKSPEKQ